MRPYIFALLLAALPAFAADDEKKPAAPASGAGKEESLPKDVRGFYGSVTGKVEVVDAAGATLKVKVTKADPDATKNKAPKPEALAGMSITITALQVASETEEGKSVLDEKASAYIRGSVAGDPVTLAVRASSKGDVFRLLKVPSAGTK